MCVADRDPGSVVWDLAPRSDRSDSRRKLIAAIVCSVFLLAASCGKGVEKIVTLTFTDEQPDSVTISTSTELGNAERGTPEAGAIEREREALLSGSDEWSVRFANADPEFERVTFQRAKKELQRVEHTGRVPHANLQRFFFDTPLIVDVLRGEGWNELTIYAGTSTRATRKQKDHVDQLLANFSEHAVRYFAATHSLYDYLDSNEGRAEPLFFTLAAIFADKEKTPGEPRPELSDVEEKLVTALAESIDAMLEGNKGDAGNVDLEFDAAFNPFPSELRVVVPGEPLVVEGFSRTEEGGLVVKSTGVLDAVAMLEGKWVSPDPIAGLLRTGEGPEVPRRFAEAMANEDRHAADVIRADDVRQALIDTMKPAVRYRVRWVRKSPDAS